MRIIYLNQYFSLPSRDGSTRSYEFARRLVRRGHTVDMVTSHRRKVQPGSPPWTHSIEEGIRVHWCQVPYANEMSYPRRIQAFVQFAWKAAHKAASLDADLIFATSTPLTIALPGVYASRRKRIPMVFEVRDLWPELPIAIGALKGRVPIALGRWLERFAYRSSNQIVALSPGMKQGIVTTGYPPEQVHIISNASDLALFDVPAERGYSFREQFDWLGDRPLVVYAGTFGRINGVDYLVRVAAEAAKLAPDVRFLVVGKGAELGRIRHEAEELGVLDTSFFILDSLPKNEIPGVLSAADIATSLFVDLPEMWANSANKFFDALASGTPVAINYQGWQADLVRQTGAGLTLNPQDAQGAARQIVQKLNDKDWLKRAGQAAQQLARDRFSRDDLTDKLEAVLLEAVES